MSSYNGEEAFFTNDKSYYGISVEDKDEIPDIIEHGTYNSLKRFAEKNTTDKRLRELALTRIREGNIIGILISSDVPLAEDIVIEKFNKKYISLLCMVEKIYEDEYSNTILVLRGDNGEQYSLINKNNKSSFLKVQGKGLLKILERDEIEFFTTPGENILIIDDKYQDIIIKSKSIESVDYMYSIPDKVLSQHLGHASDMIPYKI